LLINKYENILNEQKSKKKKKKERKKRNLSIDRSIFLFLLTKKISSLFNCIPTPTFFFSFHNCLFVSMNEWKKIFFPSFLSLQFHLMMVLTTYWQRHLTFTHTHTSVHRTMELGEFNYSLISVGHFSIDWQFRIWILFKSPYDSFMRKHLQHYGYFSGEYFLGEIFWSILWLQGRGEVIKKYGFLPPSSHLVSSSSDSESNSSDDEHGSRFSLFRSNAHFIRNI
jgi:hypothetical protein